jgi:hypothetical protein
MKRLFLIGINIYQLELIFVICSWERRKELPDVASTIGIRASRFEVVATDSMRHGWRDTRCGGSCVALRCRLEKTTLQGQWCDFITKTWWWYWVLWHRQWDVCCQWCSQFVHNMVKLLQDGSGDPNIWWVSMTRSGVIVRANLRVLGYIYGSRTKPHSGRMRRVFQCRMIGSRPSRKRSCEAFHKQKIHGKLNFLYTYTYR